MIDEARMIEIARRFRKLEDAVEAVDAHLAEKQERVQERIESLESRHACGELKYETWCARTNRAVHERDELKENRESVERCLEACRDDMNEMQEEIRRLNG